MDLGLSCELDLPSEGTGGGRFPRCNVELNVLQRVFG